MWRLFGRLHEERPGLSQLPPAMGGLGIGSFESCEWESCINSSLEGLGSWEPAVPKTGSALASGKGGVVSVGWPDELKDDTDASGAARDY